MHFENSGLTAVKPSVDSATISPTNIKHTLLRRKTNAEYRGREYLTEDEVCAMVKASRQTGRYGQRDAVMILMAYRHGLRAKELCWLRWDQINFKDRVLSTWRSKGGISGTHPMQEDELRALGALIKERIEGGIYVFENERGGHLKQGAFRKIVTRAGILAKMPLPTHPHMLRHACGFALANKGRDTRLIQEYLGHRSIVSTARYTALAPGRFNGLWDESVK